jgi:MFS family permease
MASMVGLFRYFTTRRGIAIGICVSGSGVGGVVLGPLIQAAIAASGWRSALVQYGAGAAAVICAAALAFVPLEDDLGEEEKEDAATRRGAGAAPEAPAGTAPQASAESAGAGVTSAASFSTPSPTPARGSSGGGGEESSRSGDVGELDSAAPWQALPTVRSHDKLVELTPVRAHDRLMDAAAAARKRDGGSESLVEGAAAAAVDWAPLSVAPAGPEHQQQQQQRQSEAAPNATAPKSAAGLSAAASATESAFAPASSARLSIFEITQVTDFRLYCVFVTGTACAWFVVPSHFARFVVEAGLSAEQAGQLIAVQGVANAVGRVGLGLLVDALPRQKINFLRFVAVGMTCAYLLLAFLPTASYGYVFMALSGMLGGSTVSLQPSLLVDILGERNLSLGQGLFNAAQAPFGLFGPPLGGYIRSSTGSYVFVWIFVSCMTGYASIATQLMMRPALRRSVAASASVCLHARAAR